MKAPRKVTYQSGEVRFEWPDEEWLYDQYHSQGKSTPVIAKEVGATAATVLKWLRDLGIPCRSREEINRRHSQMMTGPGNPNWGSFRLKHSARMSDEGNPAWRGGTSRGYQKRLMWRSGVSYECSWCDQPGQVSEPLYRTGEYDHQGDLHLHHKDHNKCNGVLENLQWLCGPCHRLETATWNLMKKGKINLTCEGRTMVIEFK